MLGPRRVKVIIHKLWGGAILIIQNLKFGLVFGQLGCLEYTLVYLT